MSLTPVSVFDMLMSRLLCLRQTKQKYGLVNTDIHYFIPRQASKMGLQLSLVESATLVEIAGGAKVMEQHYDKEKRTEKIN